MRRDIKKAATVSAIIFVLFLAVAFVVAFVRHAVDREANLHGSIYYGFYDYSGGWYSPQVVVAFVVLFAAVNLLLPRRGRR